MTIFSGGSCSGRLGARIRLAGLLAVGLLLAACGNSDAVAESAAIVEPRPTTSVDAPASLREQLTDSDWRLVSVTGFNEPDVFDFDGPQRPTLSFWDFDEITWAGAYDGCNTTSTAVEWSEDSFRPFHRTGNVSGITTEIGCDDTNRLFSMFSTNLVASVMVAVDGDTITLTRGNRTVTAERYERPEPVPPDPSPRPPETTEAPSS